MANKYHIDYGMNGPRLMDNKTGLEVKDKPTQPTLPFNPGEIKPTKKPLVQTPFFPDTNEGVDHFIKYAKMDNADNPKKIKELDDLGTKMKRSLINDYTKELKPFDNLDKRTYPSDPKQRGKLLEIGKLEKALEPERFNDKILKRGKYEPKKAKRNYWDHFRKTGRILEPTKEEMKRVSGPSDWEIIYQSMTPIEKGQWNAEKRKQGMNGRTGDPLPKEEPKKTPEINLNNSLEDIRQLRRDAENLQQLRHLPTKVNYEIRKPEPVVGLHENFVKDKLLEGSILKQIKEDNDKI